MKCSFLCDWSIFFLTHEPRTTHSLYTSATCPVSSWDKSHNFDLSPKRILLFCHQRTEWLTHVLLTLSSWLCPGLVCHQSRPRCACLFYFQLVHGSQQTYARKWRETRRKKMPRIKTWFHLLRQKGGEWKAMLVVGSLHRHLWWLPRQNLLGKFTVLKVSTSKVTVAINNAHASVRIPPVVLAGNRRVFLQLS